MAAPAPGEETTLYIPVERSQDVIAVKIGPQHATDPSDVVVSTLKQTRFWLLSG